MNDSILLTSTIGSFPKPEYLTKARAAVARGAMAEAELKAAEERATRETVALQEELGIDVLVDGEMYRGDMATYFAERMDGFAISGLVRSYGNRYYRKPIVTGPIGRPKPISVDWWRWAQSLTSKPMKAILTGPYTMMDWSFDEHYASRRDACLALARAIAEEVRDLDRAGAKWIQIDEPALSVRADEIDLAIEAMRIVTAETSATTLTHICYGTFEQIYPKMLDLAVDEIDLAMANTDFSLVDWFGKYPYTKRLGLGVFDVHSHALEPVDSMRAGIERTLRYLKPEQITVVPDCGLKTRTWEESKAKLANMVEATGQARAKLGARV
jgi:5-methyltetrahydropteroyltriglutamate--homocysteine methyltransferase